MAATGGGTATKAGTTAPAGYTGTAKANTNTPIANPTGSGYDATGNYKYPTAVSVNKLTDASGNPLKAVTRTTEGNNINTAATDQYLNNPGAFVPTQGQDTTNYYQGLINMSNAGTPLTGGAQDAIMGLMQGGGMNGQQQPDANQQYLTNYANGSQIGASNDLMNKVLAATGKQTADQVNLNASLGGRYGSGAYQSQLTDQLGNLYNSAALGQMNQDIQNQFAASNAISGEQQNAYQNQLGANNLGLQAANAAPAIYNFQSAPLGLLGQVGQAKDAYADAVKQAPVNALNNYAGLYNATRPTVTGSSGSSSQQSGLQKAAGVATGIGGILGSINW